jgi:hypothetical protein
MTNFDQPNNKPKYYGSGVEQIEKEIDKIEKLVEKARVLLVGDKKNLTRADKRVINGIINAAESYAQELWVESDRIKKNY